MYVHTNQADHLSLNPINLSETVTAQFANLFLTLGVEYLLYGSNSYRSRQTNCELSNKGGTNIYCYQGVPFSTIRVDTYQVLCFKRVYANPLK